MLHFLVLIFLFILQTNSLPEALHAHDRNVTFNKNCTMTWENTTQSLLYLHAGSLICKHCLICLFLFCCCESSFCEVITISHIVFFIFFLERGWGVYLFFLTKKMSGFSVIDGGGSISYSSYLIQKIQ